MRIEQRVAYPEGPLTLAVAATVLVEGVKAVRAGVTAFDLRGVTQVDSAALSLLLSWRREAQSVASSLRFLHLPESLRSLARLYGLAEQFD